MSDRLAKAHRRSVEVLSVRPDLAQVSTTVRARIEKGVTCKVTAGDHSLTVDLPGGAGGFDRGPTPSELVASALAACIGQGYIATAAHQEIQLDSVEVTVEGEFDARGMYGIDPQISAGFAKLEYVISLRSPEYLSGSQNSMSLSSDTALSSTISLGGSRSTAATGTNRQSDNRQGTSHSRGADLAHLLKCVLFAQNW